MKHKSCDHVCHNHVALEACDASIMLPLYGSSIRKNNQPADVSENRSTQQFFVQNYRTSTDEWAATMVYDVHRICCAAAVPTVEGAKAGMVLPMGLPLALLFACFPPVSKCLATSGY